MKLTIEEAYKAMFVFLDEIYKQTKSEDMGCLLGGMEFLASDNLPAVPECWEIWLECVEKNKKDSQLTPEEAYKAMISFLYENYKQTQSKDINNLLHKMKLISDDNLPSDSTFRKTWLECVKKVKKGEIDIIKVFIKKTKGFE